MKINNQILKTIAEYEKRIKGLVNFIHLARLDITKSLREERKRRKLSLRKAAKLLGISAPYLQDVETGRRELSLNMLEKIKKF